ncbi:MAG: hypothetical protein K9W44_02320 [Candidatus Lokiarchaeota archaeon]|nr:hypothetical protein [Candidatus Harpocratesius repetitus]
MTQFFKKEYQTAALKIIQKYGILSPEILQHELKIKFENTQKLIDFLFIQGFIKEKIDKKDPMENSNTRNICQNGCKGCPFNSISQCSISKSRKNYFLTEKALNFIQSS